MYGVKPTGSWNTANAAGGCGSKQKPEWSAQTATGNQSAIVRRTPPKGKSHERKGDAVSLFEISMKMFPEHWQGKLV